VYLIVSAIEYKPYYIQSFQLILLLTHVCRTFPGTPQKNFMKKDVSHQLLLNEYCIRVQQYLQCESKNPP